MLPSLNGNTASASCKAKMLAPKPKKMKKKIAAFSRPAIAFQLQCRNLHPYFSSYGETAKEYSFGIRNSSNNKVVVLRLCKQGRLKDAINLVHVMMKQESGVDCDIFSCLLTACRNKNALELGKLVHAMIREAGMEIETRGYVGNKLLSFYAKCGSVADARTLFDKMSQTSSVSWTIIISAYAKRGFCEQALQLYDEMQMRGIQADEYTFASLVPASNSYRVLQMLHQHIIEAKVESNVFVSTSLVDMYSKFGRIEDARHVFDKIPQRNVVSWTAMIAGYAQNGNVNEGMKLFEKMPFRDLVSWNMMIGVFGQNGCVKEALKLFEEMPEQNVISWTTMIAVYAQNSFINEALKLFEKMPASGRDVVAWSAMIAGCVQNGCFDEALKLFGEMKRTGITPNVITFAGVLPAYANLATLQNGKKLHADVIRRGCHSDVFVGSGLVDMYAKCGSITSARELFDTIQEPNVVVWNAMILGYAMHGCGKEAIHLFEQMQSSGTKPDHVSFVAILSACCHAGLVDNGWQYFACMDQHYGITPHAQHFCCMVDLLGRLGRLDDALVFIGKMPIKPDAAVWGSLLGSCTMHKNIKLGQYAAQHLFELDSNNSTNYVLLSNMYAATGRWDDKEKVRETMKDRNLKKTPGRSWIVIKDKVHYFLVGDRSHPQTQDIYAKLESLAGQLNEAGFVPDTNFVLHDVEEEQKPHALRYHSEKLAIAFGLISTSPSTTIRVVKNIRICGDCHMVVKFISKMEKREVILRDANRFHHFKDGDCSCGNYW